MQNMHQHAHVNSPPHVARNAVHHALPLINVTMFSTIPVPNRPLGRRWHVNVTVLPAAFHNHFKSLQHLRSVMGQYRHHVRSAAQQKNK
jgi:hypothetical protein